MREKIIHGAAGAILASLTMALGSELRSARDSVVAVVSWREQHEREHVRLAQHSSVTDTDVRNLRDKSIRQEQRIGQCFDVAERLRDDISEIRRAD